MRRTVWRRGSWSLRATGVLILVMAVGGCKEKPGASSGESKSASPTGRQAARQSGSGGGPAVQWFKDITLESGLDFVHETGATGALLFPEIMASGAALFDYDNDGDLDIYLTNGARAFDRSRADLTNKLYRQAPDGRFSDVTAESGLGDIGYGMGVAIGDIDNDGDADVYCTNYGPDRLYRNRGDGTFEDATASAGIQVDGWGGSAVFFDYDRDGFLDLFVTRYVQGDPAKFCFDSAGRRDYCGPKSFVPAHDILLHNNGDGTFSDVTDQAGISALEANGLGVISEDFNLDGWPDLYVANDATPNHLWVNQKDGTFRDDALMLGVAYNMHGQPEAGMGVLAADFDNDLDFDLFMTHLQNESNTLYLNLGWDRGFDDASTSKGLASSSVPYTGFGTVALDVELDGDLDLFVANGRVVVSKSLGGAQLQSSWHMLAEPNLFYLNRGDGSFALSGAETASLCEPLEIGRGLAVGDIDRDGDLDILLSNLQGPARLYRNEAPRQGHWITVRAIDPRLKRDAIGAVVTVSAGGRKQMRSISRGYSYLSSSEPRAHFGLGRTEQIDYIDVRWPDGLLERFTVQKADRAVTLLRGTGKEQS